MKYMIAYNESIKKFVVWRVSNGGAADIVMMKKSKRACELALIQKGISDWIDRT